MKPDPSTLNTTTGTMPSTSAGFRLPADFCGLNRLTARLLEQAEDAPYWSTLDELYGIVEGLLRLQSGLLQLRLRRQGKSEEEIDLFLDLLRGSNAGEER